MTVFASVFEQLTASEWFAAKYVETSFSEKQVNCDYYINYIEHIKRSAGGSAYLHVQIIVACCAALHTPFQCFIDLVQYYYQLGVIYYITKL
jgi:hypothetical protein